MRTPIFLDANASMPALPEARAAAAHALTVDGNPSSPHERGRAARRVLDEARDAIATALGAQPKELVLTSGASESNRFVVDAIIATGRARHAPLRVWTTPLEHASLQKPLAVAGLDGSVILDVTTVVPSWSLDGVARADVVVITAAHNETGLLPDLASVLASVKPETIVIVDAAQAVARMAVLPARVDAIVASAHKIGGFAGAGALVLRGRARGLRGPWTGGGQEGGLRPGTEALVLHAAFGAAARVVETTRAAHRALAPLRDRLEQALVTACGVEIVARGPRLDNTSALAIPDVDGDALRLALDQAGVLVGFGSACSALAPEPSSSLLALGLSPDLARATVRFSLGPTTTSDEIDAAIPRIVTVIERLRLRRRDRTRATYLKV